MRICTERPCYDCLRTQGITDPKRLDHRGRLRYPPDGRYLLLLVEDEEQRKRLAVAGSRVE